MEKIGVIPLHGMRGSQAEMLSLLLVHEDGSSLDNDIVWESNEDEQHIRVNVLRYQCNMKVSGEEDGPNKEAVKLLNALGNVIERAPNTHFLAMTTSYGGMILSKALLLAASCDGLHLPIASKILYNKIPSHIRSITFVKTTTKNQALFGGLAATEHLSCLLQADFRHLPVRGVQISSQDPAQGLSQLVRQSVENAGMNEISMNYFSLDVVDGYPSMFMVAIPADLFQNSRKLDHNIMSIGDITLFAAEEECNSSELDLVYRAVKAISAIKEPYDPGPEQDPVCSERPPASNVSTPTIPHSFSWPGIENSNTAERCPSRQSSVGRRALSVDFGSERGSLDTAITSFRRPSASTAQTSFLPSASRTTSEVTISSSSSWYRDDSISRGRSHHERQTDPPAPVVIHHHVSKSSARDLLIGASAGALFAASVSNSAAQTTEKAASVATTAVQGVPSQSFFQRIQRLGSYLRTTSGYNAQNNRFLSEKHDDDKKVGPREKVAGELGFESDSDEEFFEATPTNRPDNQDPTRGVRRPPVVSERPRYTHSTSRGRSVRDFEQGEVERMRKLWHDRPPRDPPEFSPGIPPRDSFPKDPSVLPSSSMTSRFT